MKEKQLKTVIAIILFLISNFVNAEAWICHYQTQNGMSESMEKFEKKGNKFYWSGEYESQKPKEFKIIKKTDNSYLLTDSEVDSAYVVRLYKISNTKGVIKFVDMLSASNIGSYEGNCLIN